MTARTHRRALTAGLAALTAGAVNAQPLPAETPPPPLHLSPFAPPAAPPAGPPSQAGTPTAIGGLRRLPQGAWRLSFEPGTDTPSALQRLGLMRLGGALARETTGRITLWSEVAGGEDDVSTTRRLALRRALAVRAALVAGGLAETRVDIRALGRTEAERDLVDILPFGIARD